MISVLFTASVGLLLFLKGEGFKTLMPSDLITWHLEVESDFQHSLQREN